MARKTENAGGADETVVIKKYANRRLYNTRSSSYITLGDLSRMTREGTEFQVIDAKSGDDITHVILTQIIMEEEAGGQQMLPVSFLRQIIALYGNSMQTIMPGYLEAAMENFAANRQRWQEMMGQGMMGANPFAQLAENNMAMMRAATDAFMGRSAPPAAEAAPAKQDDLAEMKAQMAAMQKRLDELGK